MIGEDDRDRLADFIAEQRDQYPRHPSEMDSEELTAFILVFLGKVAR